ncbi:patatin-like phospholipase domain-containing protein 2 [Varroa jacobsoni]|uniref:PNPLA domain-containing protein n=1 Tax=Varroa destructor TaxID=109461 RepID=A0A7M7J685_VARDE|nr:patatin-like phospholipase domain-containing protein 2 [Varroa destructor]XP_022688468.1 patatin-like phospholipase domain-containing protein 2 [Varroa jacobsoni]
MQTKPRRSRLHQEAHLSFSGCGFLGIYHVGVASAFREYAPQLVKSKVVGASSGALTACCLVNDLPFDVAVTSILRMATQSRRRALGPFHPSFNINDILFEDLGKMLPDDAHIRSTDRLHISVTKMSTMENRIITQFKTRQDLIRTLMASCFIPVFSGYFAPILEGGERYIDGGFSCNLKVYDDSTITVSPFSGESDICPQDESFNLACVHISNTSIAVSPANLYRIKRILFAPHPDVLSKMCQQGFDDGIKYLKRQQLISCVRCLAVESTLLLPVKRIGCQDDQVEPPELRHELSEKCIAGCIECDIVNRMAVAASLPEKVQQPCKEAADALNQSLYNWLFQTRTMKMLALVTAPIILPIDVTYLTAKKLYKMWPLIQKRVSDTVTTSFSNSYREVTHFLGMGVSPTSLGSGAGHISCQLAIHEFGQIEGRPRSRTLEGGQRRRQGPKRRSFAGIEKRLVSELSLGFAVEMEKQTKSRTSNILRTMNSTEDLPSVNAAVSLTNEALQRNAHRNKGIHAIVNVTRQKDALMKFFYTDDETNSVCVTEIFDLSNP